MKMYVSDERVNALIVKGMAEQAQMEAQLKAAYDEQLRVVEAAYDALDAEIRAALPDEMRGYMRRRFDDRLDDGMPEEKKIDSVMVIIPGMAPIRVYVHKGDAWAVGSPLGKTYRVPHAVVDGWDWRWSSENTDDLCVALVWAWQEGERMEQLKSDKAAKKQEPEYVADEAPGVQRMGIEDVLRSMIQDELAKHFA